MAGSNHQLVLQVMQMQSVRSTLDRVAGRVAAAVGSIAAAEQIDAGTPLRSSGTKPKGRSYSRVALGDGAEEWGTAKTPRRRALGRAASAATIR